MKRKKKQRKRQKDENNNRNKKKLLAEGTVFARFAFKSIYHIFLFLFSFLHFAYFSTYVFIFFIISRHSQCYIFISRAQYKYICGSVASLFVVWKVDYILFDLSSIQLNAKHLFNNDENTNMNGNHDGSGNNYHHTKNYNNRYYMNLSEITRTSEKIASDYIKCE